MVKFRIPNTNGFKLNNLTLKDKKQFVFNYYNISNFIQKLCNVKQKTC